MSKTTDENKNLIEKNLKYIGLNLDEIPEFLTEFEPLNFRPLKSYDEAKYKIYRHINVQDIQILITPTDRLTDIKEKYKLAAPIYAYLDEKSEENIEKFATFLKMLTNLDVEKLEKIEEEQEKLKNVIPAKVKYENHYIWQIYYSDYAHKYFMLVPTNEQDVSGLFYLLKKQIDSAKNEKEETIFVPISYLEYSGEFLTKSEMIDIENYLWYFTKEWVDIYEVYDEKNKMSIRIVGQTNVYEKIKSDYVVVLNSKKEAGEFYKLLKAMFILATGAQTEYKFKAQISTEGKLEFIHKNRVMSYEILARYINEEYIEKIEKLKKEIKETKKLEKRLKRFNLIVEELVQEYLLRQKQIATFLECKKTFFGRVKYYFKKKKDVPIVKKPEKVERDTSTVEKELQELYEEKEQYTIEDLIDICAKLEDKRKENTNINLDINAIETKKEVLTRKIDNADLYIKEIDKHKKSIFEFWKFTSKDEVQTLNQGTEEEEKKREKIEKYFDYEEDLEDLGKKVDELQRRKLSKNETDSIFAAKHTINSIRELDRVRKSKYNTTENVKLEQNKEEKGEGKLEQIESIIQEESNKVEQKEESVVDKQDVHEDTKVEKIELIENRKIFEKELEELKEEYKENIEYINMKDFDIFGGLSEDITKIKMINNQKHREIEKDKYKVLNVNLETQVDVYRDNLQYYLGLIKEAFNKIQAPYNMSIYKINDKKEINGIDIFDINPEKAIQDIMNSEKENIILCRVNIKEKMPIIYYSNIMFYDNFNKTLPLGMDLSTEVLIDLDKIKVECIKEEEFNINYYLEEEAVTKKIKVYEYDTSNVM